MRSRNKFVDEGLREESGADSFADLEGFVVDEDDLAEVLGEEMDVDSFVGSRNGGEGDEEDEDDYDEDEASDDERGTSSSDTDESDDIESSEEEEVAPPKRKRQRTIKSV